MAAWDLSFEHGAQLQKSLLMLSADKKARGDESAITLSLDSFPFGNSHAIVPAVNGFTDTIQMVDHPVNGLISGHASAEMLRPLLSVTGKRYMHSRAKLQMGPLKAYHSGPVRDSNANNRLFQENWRNLEWLIMDRAGQSDRQAVQNDLRDGRTYNSLSALAYGQHGLVDGIVVGENSVLTRPTLDQFYEAKKLKPAEVRKFNQQYKSLDDVVKWAQETEKLQTFAEFDPASVSEKSMPIYKSVVSKKEEETSKKTESPKVTAEKPPRPEPKEVNEKQGNALDLVLNNKVETPDAPKVKPKELPKEPEALPKPKFHFFNGNTKSHTWDELPHSLELKEKDSTSRLEVENLPAGLKSTLYRDSLYFPKGFDFDTGKDFFSHIKKLFDKKSQQKEQGLPTSNIVIVENSPGGSSIVTEKIRSLLESGEAPVDVVVQGWGASGGSKLVSMVDPEKGNRFATPNASILLHQTRGGSGLKAQNQVLESNRDMNYSNEGYMSLVAERSGRPLEEVEKDFSLDFWLNPVEAILYGAKGLVDGILVGPNKALTRDVVMEDMTERFHGDRKLAEQYIENRFVDKRVSKDAAYPEDHQEVDTDPLANPLAVIESLKRKRKAVDLDEEPRFKKSRADIPGEKERTWDVFTATS